MPSHGFRPSPKEVEEHNVAHIPYRSWCPLCVAGRAKDSHHTRSSKQLDSGEHVLHMDYAFLGNRVDDSGTPEELQDESDGDENDGEEVNPTRLCQS